MKKLFLITITLTAIGVAVKGTKEKNGIQKELKDLSNVLNTIQQRQEDIINVPLEF